MVSKKQMRDAVLAGGCLVLVCIVAGYTNYTIPGKGDGSISANSCEGCHTDLERLIAALPPAAPDVVGGRGDEAPRKPYHRAHLGGPGYEAFKVSGHYAVGCTGCHNGVGNTGDKNEAHSGDWIASPSMFYQQKCSACHQEVTDVFPTSLHNGTGQKRKVAIRSGFSSSVDFDQLHPKKIEGYNANCAHCHGTCGNCHVVRPDIGGGGLSNGHNFNKTPDMLNVCVACHTSRGGHAYLGVAPGTKPDVHLDKGGFDCLVCHDGHELHGDGQPVEERYAYTELPDCEDCHTGLETSNSYHTRHYKDFDCQVCHSQDYNNCAACHVHGDGASIPAYLDFKIALNPIPDLKEGFKFVLVRRTLGAPDNWEKYGVEDYADFNALPTYNYTSPHNLLKWTERTETEGDCYLHCHIRTEGESLVNKELYLFKSDLNDFDWELGANAAIAVDDQLPAAWIN